MALFREVRGNFPNYGSGCFFAENATILGEVSMGNECSIWYNAVVRGDVHSITMGNRVNVQDGAVIHATYERAATLIGNNVSIGHNAIVHGCTIEDNVLIGMGSIVMDHAVVKEGSIIAAGAVVLANTVVEAGTIYAGVPAKKVKDVSTDLVEGEIERIASSYVKYASWFQD